MKLGTDIMFLFALFLLMLVGTTQVKGAATPGPNNASLTLSNTTLEIKEEANEVISCNATFENPPMTSESGLSIVQWYDKKNDMPISIETSDDEHQVLLDDSFNSTINKTLIVLLNITIQKVNDEQFEKHFYCKINETVYNTSAEFLSVDIYAPLSLKRKTADTALCTQDPVVLQCQFRSYPILNVSWNESQSNTITISTTEEKESKTTQISLLSVENTTMYTCTAKSKYDEMNATIKVTVRDDQVSTVSHKTINDTVCQVSWNETTSDYVTGFRVMIRVGSENVTVDINGANETSYSWTMKETATVGDVFLAIVMGDCIGRFKMSNGNCTYNAASKPTNENQNDAAIIAVSVTLGILCIILLAVTVYLFCKMRTGNASGVAKASDASPRRRGNQYSTSPARGEQPRQRQESQVRDNPVGDENTYDQFIISDDENQAVYEDVVPSPAQQRRGSKGRAKVPPSTASLPQSQENYEVPMGGQSVPMHRMGSGNSGAIYANEEENMEVPNHHYRNYRYR